jgi:hypothetical protein
MAVFPVPNSTSTGTVLFAVVPSPTLPKIFKPQHLSMPMFKMAQVVLPTETELTVFSIPRSTVTGETLSVVVPSPS